MTLNEVAPPGWGHTKAEKEKTKPDKPKSKIGGSAAAFKRALDDGRFKGLPGDKTKKEKTASMFKLMWAMKKKGAKPHYKPGTDKKYEKYQEEETRNGVTLSKGKFGSTLSHGGALGKESQIAKGKRLGFSGDLKTDAERYRVPRGPGGNPKRIGDKVRSMNDNQPLGKLKTKYGAAKVRDYYKKNKAVDEGVTAKYKGTSYKLLPGKVRKKMSGKGGLDGDYRDELGKVKDAVTDKLGLTNTKKHGVKTPRGHQDYSESFEIDKTAHKTAQKKAKMRNLARGNENPNEKAAAEKKAGGPKLMGEGKKWDSYKKAVATVLGKKKEKKAEKATDAGARAKRKLQRKVHAKYVSGSEDLVPDEMRD